MIGPPLTRRDFARIRTAVDALYRYELAGCCLHVVLDDGNSDAESLQVSTDAAARRRHATCAWLAEQLGRMTVKQRRRFVHPRPRADR
jgi:hypothetical protein